MFKLGKRKAVHDPRTLKLANYVSASRLPSIPDRCNYTDKVADFPMYDNDKIGCCAIAGPAHQRQIWTANDGQLVTPSLEEVVRDYSLIGGYQPGNPQTDGGCILLDVMRRWRSHGIVGGRIAAFASIDPQNHELTAAGIFLFGGLTIGVSLPAAVQNQTNDDEWRAPSRAHLFGPWARGSWGGHCVTVHDYDEQGLTCVTWGGKKRMSWNFYETYCLAPWTKVLTADLQWVPISTLHLGQSLLGFDEYSQQVGGHRKWRRAVVEQVETIDRPCFDLALSDGTTVRCSHEHSWLVAHGNALVWRRTNQLRASGRSPSRIAKPLQPWELATSRRAGYLAAAFDGEGHLVQRDLTTDSKRTFGTAATNLGFSQKENAMLTEVVASLTALGFGYNRHTRQRDGVVRLSLSRRPDLLRFLGSIRPHRLLAKFTPDCLGTMTNCQATVTVIGKVDVGVQPVVSVRTSTGTFLAEGLASHNCDEAFAALGRDWLGPDSKAPNGFDAMALARDLGAL